MYPSAKVADLNVERSRVTTFPVSLVRSLDGIAGGRGGGGTCRSSKHHQPTLVQAG